MADRHTDIIVKIGLEARGADLMGGPFQLPIVSCLDLFVGQWIQVGWREG